VYAWIFALATVVATGVLLPGVQANGIAAGVQNAWGVSPAVTALVVAAALGIIVIGGVVRIARFAEVVPVIALAYTLMAIVVIF
jgi:AGCS family alanine or glycine:cation symporter